MPGASPATASPGWCRRAPPDGAALYAMNCQRCHGPEARGGAIHPGSIQGETGIIGIVRSGRGVMPPFPELTDEEIAAIEAYLVSLAPVVELTPLERYSMECARCHGANGEGTADGPQIQSPVPGFATWVVRNGREGLGFPDEMPAFDEAVMPQADLDEIITWLHDQPLPVDGAGYYKRFCGNCHGADARGGNARHGLVGRRLAEYLQLVRSGVGGANYSSRTRYMPRFTTTELKDADVELIWQAVNGGSL